MYVSGWATPEPSGTLSGATLVPGGTLGKQVNGICMRRDLRQVCRAYIHVHMARAD